MNPNFFLEILSKETSKIGLNIILDIMKRIISLDLQSQIFTASPEWLLPLPQGYNHKLDLKHEVKFKE